MEKMIALCCDRLSDDLSGIVVRETTAPVAGPGQVAIAVEAAALNFPDYLMAQGIYQHKPALPFVLGLEGVGTVTAIGAGVTGWREGDRACFWVPDGAIAQRMVTTPSTMRKVPPRLDAAEAAAYHVGAGTAYVSLMVRGQLQAGETLLVHGAAGGSGIPAVRLGRHVGATVIATGASDEKLAVVKSLGAHHVLNTRDGFKDKVKELTGGRGANVIYDLVGGDVFDESVRCIAWDGRLLIVGFASGRIPTMALNMPLIKGFSIVGVRANTHLSYHPEIKAAVLDEVDRLTSEGVLKPHIGARFPLARAADAIRALASRKVVGKIVVEMPKA